MAAAPVSLREKHAAQTRQRIVDVAMSLFVAQGFDATTIDQIAEGADVSPRTFFRYFPTKEALLFHDLEERLVLIQDMIAQRPATESAAVALVQALCRMVDEIESTPERRALLVRLLTERPSMRAYQRTTLVEHTEEQVIATLAARAGKEADDLGIRAMAAAVTACFDIALRHWTERGAEGRFDAVFVEALAGCQAALPEGRIEIDRA